MKRTFNYQIPLSMEGLTIKEFLLKNGYSASLLVHIKKTPESILLNHLWVHVSTILKAGDLLEILIIEDQTSPGISPVYGKFDIVYEDDDIMVIDKPAGMPIHPSINHHDDSLANGVQYLFTQRNIPFVFRCINRLDRDTSGLTLVAKHMLSAAILSKAMTARQIHREYLAVVKGAPPLSGTICSPIGRVASSVIERHVDFVSGDPAITHFIRLSTNARFSLLQLRLETGRTHQIRVHLKHEGYPLPGDFLYCPDYDAISRQPLHSYRLTFSHPITGETMDFRCPPPEDMCHLVEEPPCGYTHIPRFPLL